MSPHDPQNAIFNTGLAVAHYLAGRFAEAVSFGRKACNCVTDLPASNRIYVASLAQAGKIDEARAALARLKEMHPDLSIAWIENVPYTPHRWTSSSKACARPDSNSVGWGEVRA